MKKNSILAVVIFLFLILILVNRVYAFHWVTGYVKNSTNSVSPDGSIARIYCDEGIAYLEDYVGNGTANQSNWYMFDIDSLAGCSENGTIYSRVLENNSYYSGAVSTIVENGSFQMPNMTFNIPPVLHGLILDKTVVSTGDIITVTTTGWNDENGDSVRLNCYHSTDWNILPLNFDSTTTPLFSLCNSEYGITNRSCNFTAPSLTDGEKTIYCRLDDGLDSGIYKSNYNHSTFILDNIAPIITDIQVDSDIKNAFYVSNPFNGDNITIIFNSIAGSGANQNISIVVEYDDLTPNKLIGNDTFGNGEQINDTDINQPKIIYNIPLGAGENTTLLTVYDKLNNTDTATIVWINSTDITSQDNVPDPIFWYNNQQANITINVSSVWNISNTTYCIDDYDIEITPSYYNTYCNPKTNPDGILNYTDPTNPIGNITITCSINDSCQKVLRYYSTSTGNLEETIIRTSNPINIITGSIVSNKTASFTHIYPLSNISNSTNYHINITNSIEINSRYNNSNIFNSEILNSIADNSDLQNSYLISSIVYDTPITNASVALSNITNSTITRMDSSLYEINLTLISNSQIEDSYVTNSKIYSSFIDPSTIIDSYITNSTITNSTVRYSRIESSEICSGMEINSADIKDNTISSGKIIYEGKTFYGPFNISLICNNETLPFPIGELTYSPEYPTSDEYTILCYYAYDVGYNINSSLYSPSNALLVSGVEYYDDGNYSSHGDELANDAIYCVKGRFADIGATDSGNYTIEITEKDNVGNTNKANFTILIDNTEPEATIRINNGDLKTTTSSVTLNLGYSDEHSGIDSCAYYNGDPSITPTNETMCEALNGYWTKFNCDEGYYNATSDVYHCCLPEEQFTSCSPTREWNLLSGYGTRTVWYQVKDRAGNIATTTDSISLEPNAPIITSPENNSFVEENITIIAYAPDETTSIEFYLINSTNLINLILIKNDDNGADGWNAVLNTNDYNDAQYYLVADAYESGEFSGTYWTLINIDNNPPQPPNTILINSETGTVYDNDGNVSFLLTSSSSSDVDYYNIYKSDLPNINLTSGNIYRRVSSTPKEWYDLFQDGTYYFTATAVDISGKESQTLPVIKLVIDTTKPIGELIAEPTIISNEEKIIFKYYGYEIGLNVSINSSELNKIDSTSTSDLVFVDDGTGEDLVADDGIYTGEYTIGKFNLRSDGEYTLTAVVNDPLGNIFYPKVKVSLSNTCKYSGSGDWSISGLEICENKSFIINGKINILPDAKLIIKDSTFIFNNSNDLCNMSYNKDDNCTSGLINRGELEINNSNMQSTTQENYVIFYSNAPANNLIINNSRFNLSSYIKVSSINTKIENSKFYGNDNKIIYFALAENGFIKNNKFYFESPTLQTILNDSSRGSEISIYNSNDLNISQNDFYNNHNSSARAISIVQTNNKIHTFNNNIHKSPYEFGEGIQLTSSSDIFIYDNKIYGTRQYYNGGFIPGTGIKISSTLGDNKIYDNEIYDSTRGIWILRTNGKTEIYDNFIKNIREGVVIGENATNIYLSKNIFEDYTNNIFYFSKDLGHNYIYDTDLSGSTPIAMDDTITNISEYFINCSFNASSINLSSTNRSLYFGWYVNVNVKDNESNPIKDAEVKFRNNNNETLFTELTNQEGDINQQVAYEYKLDNTGINYLTPLRYYATKYMYEPSYGILNFTTNTILQITLSKLFDEEDYPIPATIVDEGDYTNKDTNLEFWFVNASDSASNLLGIPLKYNYSTSPTGPWIQTQDTHITLTQTFNDEDNVVLYVRTINPYGIYSESHSDGIVIDLTQPSAPNISSPTHPDNTSWYADDSPILEWKSTDGTSGISGYSYVIDKDVGTLPDQIIDAEGTQVIAQSPSYGESILLKEKENGNAYLFSQRIDTIADFNVSTLEQDDEIKVSLYLYEENSETEQGINFTICLSDDFSGGTYSCLASKQISNYDATYPMNNNPDNAIRYYTTLTLNSDASGSELYLIIVSKNSDNPANNISLSARTYNSNSQLCDYDGTNCISSNKTIKFKLEKSQGDIISKQYSNLADGVWYFHVRAVDNAGNWGPQSIYKIKINTFGSGAYIIKPVSGTITYMNKTNVKGIVLETADIELYVNDILIDSITGISDEFIFNDIPLDMGLNKIYVKADNGSLEITSNIVYITRITKPEYQLSIKLNEVPTYESNHTLYKKDSELIIGLATENPDDSTTSGGGNMEIVSGEEHTAYLIITNPNKEQELQEKEKFLSKQNFLDLINPSFGGLESPRGSERLINLMLNYNNILLNTNNEIVPAGRHTLIIKNNGYLPDGSINISIEVN